MSCHFNRALYRRDQNDWFSRHRTREMVTLLSSVNFIEQYRWNPLQSSRNKNCLKYETWTTSFGFRIIQNLTWTCKNNYFNNNEAYFWYYVLSTTYEIHFRIAHQTIGFFILNKCLIPLDFGGGIWCCCRRMLTMVKTVKFTMSCFFHSTVNSACMWPMVSGCAGKTDLKRRCVVNLTGY